MTVPPFEPNYKLPDFAALYPKEVGNDLYDWFGPYIERWGDPGNHLWVYLHALGAMLQPIDDMVKDGPEGEPGWSQMLDLRRAKTEWLPWIGQWVGYTVPDQGKQPLAEYDPIQRDQIVCMAAHRRGSIDALYDAIEYHLNEPKTIIIHERTPDPDHLDLFVLQSEIKTSLALVQQAALAAKAAGLLFTFQSVAGGTYLEFKARNTIYSTLPPKFSSYTDLKNNSGRP